MIKQVKRSGRGFRNFDNYRLRILLAGGLHATLHPSRDSEHDPAQSRRATLDSGERERALGGVLAQDIEAMSNSRQPRPA